MDWTKTGWTKMNWTKSRSTMFKGSINDNRGDKLINFIILTTGLKDVQEFSEAKTMGEMFQIYGIFGKSDMFLDNIGHSLENSNQVDFVQKLKLCAKSYIEVMYWRKKNGTRFMEKYIRDISFEKY